MEEPRRVVSELAALGLTLASRGSRRRHALNSPPSAALHWLHVCWVPRVPPAVSYANGVNKFGDDTVISNLGFVSQWEGECYYLGETVCFWHL